jgi:signal transduction histidine kinase
VSTSGPLKLADERRRAFESARLRLARLRVAGGASLGNVFREATELAARTLQVDRAGIWLFVDGRRAIRCYHLFERAGGEHSEGAMLRAEDFPAYFTALSERRAIAAGEARRDPLTRELREAYLEPLGIRAMLDAPLYRDGEVIGVVCHESRAVRSWSDADREFAASVADRVALQFEEAARKDAEALAEAQEAHLAELHKMEALGRLAAGAAHDFRNVLTAVIGFAHEIKRRTAALPEIAGAAEQIERAAERGSALARELLSFGRGEASPARVVDPAEVAAGLAPMLRKALGARHELALRCDPGTGRVLLDRAQLERVVLNLVLNARDAMPEGGSVVLRVAEEPIEGGPLHVVIEVSDTGIGMDEATRARIFEPFFTTKPEGEGTGIGLSVVFGVVERAGGFVHVESALGKGTRIRVVLPRVAAAPEARQTRGADPAR